MAQVAGMVQDVVNHCSCCRFAGRPCHADDLLPIQALCEQPDLGGQRDVCFTSCGEESILPWTRYGRVHNNQISVDEIVELMFTEPQRGCPIRRDIGQPSE